MSAPDGVAAGPTEGRDKSIDILRRVLVWSRARCPCENEQPDPCPLCGERVDGGTCRAIDKSFPDVLRQDIEWALFTSHSAGPPPSSAGLTAKVEGVVTGRCVDIMGEITLDRGGVEVRTPMSDADRRFAAAAWNRTSAEPERKSVSVIGQEVAGVTEQAENAAALAGQTAEGGAPTPDPTEIYRLRTLMLNAHRKMVRYGWTFDGSDEAHRVMLDLEAKHRGAWVDFARYVGIPLVDEVEAASPPPPSDAVAEVQARADARRAAPAAGVDLGAVEDALTLYGKAEKDLEYWSHRLPDNFRKIADERDAAHTAVLDAVRALVTPAADVAALVDNALETYASLTSATRGDPARPRYAEDVAERETEHDAARAALDAHLSALDRGPAKPRGDVEMPDGLRDFLNYLGCEGAPTPDIAELRRLAQPIRRHVASLKLTLEEADAAVERLLAMSDEEVLAQTAPVDVAMSRLVHFHAAKIAERRRDRGLADPRAGAVTETAAARDVLAERRRQVEAEGWTAEHDDAYRYGHLAAGAACYAMSAATIPGWEGNTTFRPVPESWPFPDEWWKPTTSRRDLIKAGALILAEIERLDRADRARIAAEDRARGGQPEEG